MNPCDIVITLQGEQLTLQELFDRLSKLTAELEGQVKELVSDKDRMETGIRNFLAGDHPNPAKYYPGKCPHEHNYWESCEQCNCEYFEALLKGKQ